MQTFIASFIDYYEDETYSACGSVQQSKSADEGKQCIRCSSTSMAATSSSM
jgi:hypothetical protein